MAPWHPLREKARPPTPIRTDIATRLDRAPFARFIRPPFLCNSKRRIRKPSSRTRAVFPFPFEVGPLPRMTIRAQPGPGRRASRDLSSPKHRKTLKKHLNSLVFNQESIPRICILFRLNSAQWFYVASIGHPALHTDRRPSPPINRRMPCETVDSKEDIPLRINQLAKKTEIKKLPSADGKPPLNSAGHLSGILRVPIHLAPAEMLGSHESPGASLSCPPGGVYSSSSSTGLLALAKIFSATSCGTMS